MHFIKLENPRILKVTIEKSVKIRTGFTDLDKQMIKLPRETQDGIHITGMLICICVHTYLRMPHLYILVEFIPYIFTKIPGVPRF